jgi:hypothetical protein
MSWPPAPFQHLLRMSDSVGLLEHASGIVPRYEHGYCVDDVARGLVVVCREPSPSADLLVLAHRYLSFLAQAQGPDGRFRNRLGYDGRWRDQPAAADWWGRALWGLGTAALRGPAPEIRSESLDRFAAGASVSSPWPRAMAFAALGAAEILGGWPDHPGARRLLASASAVIGQPPAGRGWPWPEPRLGYANGAIAEAVIAAGSILGDDKVLRDGLRMLEWLLATETRNGHLSVTPAGGWGPGEPRPAFDQQPIEVAALADACMRAMTVTGDASWLAAVEMCVAWFLGDNDTGVAMLDQQTGGGCDGLTLAGRNGNQGAESTMAMISVLQQGRRLIASPR